MGSHVMDKSIFVALFRRKHLPLKKALGLIGGADQGKSVSRYHHIPKKAINRA